MEIIAFSKNTQQEVLKKTEMVLRSGGIVIGPTDTVYGIFGNAEKKKTIENMFILKQRSQEKAFPVFVKDMTTARYHAYISDGKAKFLEKIWPGAVTVIFHHKRKLPKILTGGKDTIGLRIPDHPFLRELLARLDFPLIQTSANISGKPPAKNLKEIEDYFDLQELKPDLVIDAGEISGSPSSIVDFTRDQMRLVRTRWLSKIELDQIFIHP